MSHKKSTIKRLRQTKALNARNRAVKARVATAVKKAKTAPAEERDAALREAVSVIDRAVKAGVLKKEIASRRKSRLAKELSKAQ